MQITLKTPTTEMSFEMVQEKAADLMHRAFLYANGQDTETVTQEAAQDVSTLAPEPPRTTHSDLAQPETPKPANRPRSRVERMFGDIRARIPRQNRNAEQHEPEIYKGFLLIRCSHCGEIKGFCAKSEISRYTCPCGGKTDLRDLKMLHLHCECGASFSYKTNTPEEMFDYPCLKCGNPVAVRLNRRGDTYVTITDRSEKQE